MMPKLAAVLLASIALAALAPPAALAKDGAKDPRSCGTVTFRIGVTGPSYATLTKAWVHETIKVAKGSVTCKEAKRIAGNDPYTLGNNHAYRRNGWLCDDDYNGCVQRQGAHDFTGQLIGEITTRYRYESEAEAIEKRGARVEEEECRSQTFPSLSCEKKGFGESEAARQRQQENEWYAECEHARENEQEPSEEGLRTPTPAEAKADCKAEHERDERANT